MTTMPLDTLAETARRRAPAGAAVLLSCLLALGSACTDSGTTTSQNPGKGDAQVYRVAMIPKGTTHTFWDYIHAGALKGAKELEKELGVRVEVLWNGPETEKERARQIEIVETFTNQNVDAIVLAPIDDHALVRPVRDAMRKGIPVVIIDSGLESEDYISFVATDNYKGGKLAGERVAQILGGKGKVLLLRYQEGSASTTKREQGFIDVMKEHPEVELVPPGLGQYAGATSTDAQQISETLLNRYSDIDAIFCPNESSASGMLEALKKSGRAGKLKFVGFDSSDKLILGLQEEALHGLILQDPVGMAASGVKTAVAHLRGDEVDKRVDTGVHLVTKETMDTPRGRALLRPDISILGK